MGDYHFPDPRFADEEGVVAVGGPMSVKRLLAAYRQGIFPWSGDPLRWHSPDPRSIFWEVKLPSRLGKVARSNGFRISYDCAFRQVIEGCRAVHQEEGEWITAQFVEAYTALHEAGWAHSVEVWQGDTLAGGLYGVHIGGLFAGESMFYRVANASKVAFAGLVYHLDALNIALFDCQVINGHTLRHGAALVHRDDYLRLLKLALSLDTPYSGRLWPPLGCASLDATPLKDAVDPEHRNRIIPRTETDQRAERGPPRPRFWRLEQ